MSFNVNNVNLCEDWENTLNKHFTMSVCVGGGEYFNQNINENKHIYRTITLKRNYECKHGKILTLKFIHDL